jgi:hypothetical protein
MSVFKYRNGEKGLKILADLEMPLAASNEFNDPFEYQPTLTSDEMTKEKAIQSLNNEELFELWFSQPRLRYDNKKWWRDWYFNNLDKIYADLSGHLMVGVKWLEENFANQTAKFWKIGCYSLTSEDTLMWTHYADEHKGIAIEFDLTRPPFNKTSTIKILEVDYSDEKVPYDFPQSNEDFEKTLHAISKRKKLCWSYEREVRILVAIGSLRENRFLVLDASSIVSVTYGLRCPEELRKNVIEALKPSYFQHVKVYEIRRNLENNTFCRMQISP